ncbi:MAG TPA: hypothetical protein VMW40_02465 [Candidatus Bathyarchaeia archaeon]|nr:hypothetical protein [Candidatus Bathyarchaeia archaeon]
MQERDNESEAEQKPPDSYSVGVIRIKSLRSGMSKGKEDAFWHKIGGRDGGRDKYANANPGITKESLEGSSQSFLFLLSQLRRLI